MEINGTDAELDRFAEKVAERIDVEKTSCPLNMTESDVANIRTFLVEDLAKLRTFLQRRESMYNWMIRSFIAVCVTTVLGLCVFGLIAYIRSAPMVAPLGM